jgi:Putative cyclase
VEDIEGALRAQNVDVTPGTVVLLRTGTARYWGSEVSNREHDDDYTHLFRNVFGVNVGPGVMIGSLNDWNASCP